MCGNVQTHAHARSLPHVTCKRTHHTNARVSVSCDTVVDSIQLITGYSYFHNVRLNVNRMSMVNLCLHVYTHTHTQTHTPTHTRTYIQTPPHTGTHVLLGCWDGRFHKVPIWKPHDGLSHHCLRHGYLMCRHIFFCPKNLILHRNMSVEIYTENVVVFHHSLCAVSI